MSMDIDGWKKAARLIDGLADTDRDGEIKAAAKGLFGALVAGIEVHSGLIEEMKDHLAAALEYIDAIPDDVAAALPAMPGFDRDRVDYMMDRLKDFPSMNFAEIEAGLAE